MAQYDRGHRTISSISCNTPKIDYYFRIWEGVIFFCFFIICEYVHKRVGGPTFKLNQIYFFDAFTFVKWLGVELRIYKESDSEGLS